MALLRTELQKMAENVQSKQAALNAKQIEMQKTIGKIKEEQAAVKGEIKEGHAALKGEISRVKEDEKILYYCPHEVKNIEDHGFYTTRQSLTYLDGYRQLVQGLDEESVRTINRILSRHLLVSGRSGEQIDLFSKEEQEVITRQRREFYARSTDCTRSFRVRKVPACDTGWRHGLY